LQQCSNCYRPSGQKWKSEIKYYIKILNERQLHVIRLIINQRLKLFIVCKCVKQLQHRESSVQVNLHNSSYNHDGFIYTHSDFLTVKIHMRASQQAHALIVLRMYLVLINVHGA
jgi:hypothetical protein